jgi:uncharacterized Zn finger protein
VKGWNRWDVFVPIKRPPPAHGIKLNKAGTTWWGQRWIEALESVLRGQAGRLSRGRTYARAGRTHDLVIAGGKISAKVTGSRDTPYDVSLELSAFDAQTWDQAIAGMAARAQFAAELLGGRMPEAIDEVFGAAGRSLFPQKKAELYTHCSCPDNGDPCKHIAATHYLLGEALDRDPFLLFELRGRTKTEVLSALREARAAGSAKPSRSKKPVRPSERVAAPALPETPAVSLGRVRPEEFDAPRTSLPALHFSFEAPDHHGAVLRQLGAPAAWSGEQSPAEVLAPVVRAAAEIARRIALAEAPGETGPSAEPAAEMTAAPKKPRAGAKPKARRRSR